jgi:cyclopropane fatty-acyl-phospholipid synthase-like methyltransferase
MATGITFKDELRAAYDADATRRITSAKKRSQWKLDARQQFSDLVKRENKKSILEIGAGAGLDAKFFQEEGLEVLATDLSPNMVAECKKIGLIAEVVDIYDLEKLEHRFDAIYSLNVLLHVPPEDLDKVLSTIHGRLNENGLFFYGVYGGTNKEETYTDPTRMNIPRYFSFLDDNTLVNCVSALFSVVKSDTIDIGDEQAGLHFQSLLLRKK